ncbi:MAG: hypothetical protein AB7K36_23460 [Chloroflexota bacterium]
MAVRQVTRDLNSPGADAYLGRAPLFLTPYILVPHIWCRADALLLRLLGAYRAVPVCHLTESWRSQNVA